MDKKCEHLDDWGYCKLSVFYPQFVYPCNIDYCFKKSLDQIKKEQESKNEGKNT
jgi:hypothetical protein